MLHALFYYKVAILGSPLSSLTFESSLKFEPCQFIVVFFQKKEKLAVVVESVEKPDFKTENIQKILPQYFSLSQYLIAQFISEYYFCSLGEALQLFVPFNSDTKATLSECSLQRIALSLKQQEALDFLKQHKVSLLFGDTGSGKTEIYMSYFQELTCKGRRALFLLPEISLTPQMQRRLEVHFGDGVVLWHSKMSKAQKAKTLEKILNGEAMIIAGPRSALFLPIENLGLIVVDEEHDDSYKSASRPRYHARDVAIYMGKVLGIPVVLGSATPSLSSYEKFPHVRLKGGYYESKRSFVFEPQRESISTFLAEMVANNAKANRQAIMFIPTRANYKYLICDTCGYTLECPFCSVGMSLHAKHNAMKCHYCNYTEPIPTQCAKCGSHMLENARMGTAEAIAYFQTHQPKLRTLQFDRDTITTQKKLIHALQQFNEGEIDLLIGTQMLSKGHDYHDVTLAVVMGLDNMLQLSDYRAREKTLSLLIQIAGRAGRKHDAKVIVQSYYEHFFAPYLDNYEQFLEDEKKVRKGLYPPYKKMARLLFSHKKRETAYDAMHEMLTKIQTYSNNVEVVGYGAAAIERIGSKYRFAILLRSDKSTHLIKVIKATRHKLSEVDMDPVEFS